MRIALVALSLFFISDFSFASLSGLGDMISNFAGAMSTVERAGKTVKNFIKQNEEDDNDYYPNTFQNRNIRRMNVRGNSNYQTNQLPDRIIYDKRTSDSFYDENDWYYQNNESNNNAQPNGGFYNTSNYLSDQNDYSDNQVTRKGNGKLGNHGKLLKRSALFNDRRAKLMCLSPQGKRIAYVSKENGKDVVYLLFLRAPDGPRAIFRAENGIESIRFPSEGWVALTVRNNRNCLNLILLDLANNRYIPIQLDNNIKAMELKCASKTTNLAIRCFNGQEYITYIIQIPALKVHRFKKDKIPAWMSFDDSLNVTGYCKNFDGSSADVFICRPDGSMLRNIDKINFNNEKFVAIRGNNYYKIQKSGQRFQLIVRNLANNSTRTITLNLNNASSNANDLILGAKLEDYEVFFDTNNAPLFVTRNIGKITNISISSFANAPVNALNNKFYNSSWRKIDETSDGNLWLIRVSSPTQHNSYFLFNKRNGHFTELTSANQISYSVPLAQVSCVQIPLNNVSEEGQSNDIIYGYLVRASSSPKAPLIIFAEANGKHKFNWEFDGMTQLLVNRGFNVLCVNCCIKRIDDGPVVTQQKVRNMSANIMSVVNWCLSKNIVQQGRITLVGKRANGIYCTDAFIRNQQMFSSCIVISTDFPEFADPVINPENQSVLSSLQKPLIVLNSRRNSEKYIPIFSSMGTSFGGNLPGIMYDYDDNDNYGTTNESQSPKLVYMAYNDVPNDSDSAAILEKIVCSVYNFVSEPITAQQLSLFPRLFDSTEIFKEDPDMRYYQ